MEIGFIGLGIMGRPMAQNIARAGHALHLYARRPESLAPFEGKATIHASAALVGSHADIVITIVADAPDVEAVALGPDGVAAGARAAGRSDLILIDMSTIAPPAARGIATRLAEAGVTMLDAPVSGGEPGAIHGTLTIMVGGPQPEFERALPVLQAMGRSVTLIGPTGAGQVAKACNQILTGAGVAAVAEAFNLARAHGVDPANVRTALMGGMARSAILDNHGNRMIARNFKPGFKSWMHQKDLRIVLEEAHRLGLGLPLAAAVAQMFNAMQGAGMAEEDSVAMLKLYERLSGVE
ncbi:MAG: NAD-binding protein [Rhodocyclaceae bacterium]|nr:NAD-binding protein [Rhodocyclaceae bacterium]MBX3670373.1 NAD-binding protein [Rhodocyclaceae bacterium]